MSRASALLAPLLLSTALAASNAPVKTVSEVPTRTISDGKGTAQVLFGAHEGSSAGLTLLVLSPGAAVSEHVHDASDELLFVLEGEAAMTLDGVPLTLKVGQAARIPKGARHTARVTSERPFRAVQVYAPAGPEQRFLPAPPGK